MCRPAEDLPRSAYSSHAMPLEDMMGGLKIWPDIRSALLRHGRVQIFSRYSGRLLEPVDAIYMYVGTYA
jgi:hypothetical protein